MLQVISRGAYYPHEVTAGGQRGHCAMDCLANVIVTKHRSGHTIIADISQYCHYRRLCTFFKPVYLKAQRTQNLG